MSLDSTSSAGGRERLYQNRYADDLEGLLATLATISTLSTPRSPPLLHPPLPALMYPSTESTFAA
ncbi:hypothetical protein V8E53_000094 [Lactarius tabidus]